MKNDVNNFLHKFSKAVVADGQLYQSQASVRSGHNVDYVTVRGEDIPVCAYRQVLLTSTKNVKAQYTNVLKFWNQADMTEYPDSNGQSYYLLDNNQIVSDFIDPSDKLIDGRELSRGYAPIVYGVKSNGDLEKISPIYYTFESYSGILTFDKQKTPKKLNYIGVKIDVFQYIGKNVKENFKNIEELIAMNLMLMQKMSAQRIVVQPYKFSTQNMTAINDPKPIPGAFNKFGKQMWCQTFKIEIPGYVFETSAVSCYAGSDKNDTLDLYDNGVIIPDMIHLPNGNTVIQVELQVDAGQDMETTGSGKIILGYEEYNETGTNRPGLRIRVGNINFVASTFKRNDNFKLDVKDPIVMEGEGSTLSAITPDLKKKLLVDQYVVDFSAYPEEKETSVSVNNNITQLLDKVK